MSLTKILQNNINVVGIMCETEHETKMLRNFFKKNNFEFIDSEMLHDPESVYFPMHRRKVICVSRDACDKTGLTYTTFKNI